MEDALGPAVQLLHRFGGSLNRLNQSLDLGLDPCGTLAVAVSGVDYRAASSYLILMRSMTDHNRHISAWFMGRNTISHDIIMAVDLDAWHRA